MKRTKATPVLDWFRKTAVDIENDEVRQFQAAGGKVIGCLDPDTPLEILEAAGAMTYALRGTGTDGTELADAYFKQLTCEYTRAIFNQILGEEYKFLDGAVFYNNCDHQRRIFDNWIEFVKDSPAYSFFYLPKKRSESAYEFYRKEIAGLVAKTEARYGVKITPEKLLEAIRESNRTRRLVAALYDLRKGDDVYIDGAEIADVLMTIRSVPRKVGNDKLEALIAELKAGGETVRPKYRLMFATHHADRSDLSEVLESEDAMIVTDSLVAGVWTADVMIPEEGDPLENIMHFYFWDRTPMPRVFGTQDQRLEHYVRVMKEFNAQGIISARVAFCDLWAFEQFMLLDYLKEQGVPQLQLEVGYILTGEGQMRTRLQAFLESLPARA